MIREETAALSNSAAEDAHGALEENKSPTASVRRLRRERTSEVACSNVPSPPRSGKSSAKKGKGLFRSKIASGEKKRQQQNKRQQPQRQPLSPVPKAGNAPRGSESDVESERSESFIESSYQQSSDSEHSDYE